MRTSGPPMLATWLMTRLTSGEKRESLIGDLIEQHRHGRSSAWYWRQAISAIATSFAADIWQHAALAIWVFALGMYLPRIYMFLVRPRWVAWLDGWHPRLINWLLERDLDGVRHVAYRLHLHALTSTIVWCTLVAAVAWLLVRLHRRQRGVVLTLFLLSQVVPCVLYLRIALTDWLHEPSNPIWFFNVFWYSIFTFVLMPLSVLLGGRCGSPRVGSRA